MGIISSQMFFVESSYDRLRIDKALGFRKCDINKKHKNKRSNNNVSSHTEQEAHCCETVRRDSMPRIAEMDVEMTT